MMMMMMNYSSAVLLLSAAFAPSQFFTFVGAVNKIRGGSIDTFSDGNGDGELLPRVLGRKPPPTPRPPTLPATSPPTIPSTAPPTAPPTPFPTGLQTCPEQYCPAPSSPTRKLKATFSPRRRNVDQCNMAMVSLFNYTVPGTTDILIELKGPANSADALDLVIAAPHGGSKKPTYIDDRSGNGIVTDKDSFTFEISELFAQSLIDRYCAGVPYLAVNHLHRSKLDANRELAEAVSGIVNGVDIATEAWTQYHTLINYAQGLVRDKFGTSTGSTGVTGVNALFFDMHGYKGNDAESNAAATTGWKDDVNIYGGAFTQWGFRLSDTPSLTSCPIDDIDSGSTIGSLTHARWLDGQSYECLVRGKTSLASRVNSLLPNVAGISNLCGKGTPSFEFPSPYHLATDTTYCLGACHYYSGGFDVQIHERMDVDLTVLPEPSLSGDHFNAMQAELPRCIRFGGNAIRSEFADVLAQATMGFLRDLYPQNMR